MKHDTVTIYCCGTGGHSGKHAKWAVPYLYSIDVGRKHICDGPGGKPILKAEDVIRQVEKGSNTSSRFSRFTSMFKSPIKFDKTSGGGVRTKLSGVGTQDNIVISLQWLWEQWHKAPFSTINLIGWSRGAVTCIMLAHSIEAAGFPIIKGNLKVNIFAFDPVAGQKNDFSIKGKDFDNSGRAGTVDKLASCVTSYASILQENMDGKVGVFFDRDKEFQCVTPTALSSGTKIFLYPMPGKHGDAGKYNEAQGGGPVGQIGMHLAQYFLIANGTEFSNHHILSSAILVKNYAKTRLQYMKKKSTDKKAPSNYRRAAISNPFRDHIFFINPHHAELLAITNSSLSNYLNGQGTFNPTDVSRLAIGEPSTYDALITLGLIQ